MGEGPNLDFEALLAQLEQADRTIASQSRLRDLVRVNHDLTSNLDLPTVLRRIVNVSADAGSS